MFRNYILGMEMSTTMQKYTCACTIINMVNCFINLHNYRP